MRSRARSSRISRRRKSSRSSMQDANTTAGVRRTTIRFGDRICRMRARARRRRRCWASCRKSGSSSNCAHRAQRGRSGATRSARSTGAPIRRICRHVTTPWPGAGYASLGGGDWSGYLTERAEIFDFVRDNRIAGFAIVSGDRHSFWAGLAAKALPPRKFEPVGVVFHHGLDLGAGAAGSPPSTICRASIRCARCIVHQTAPDAPVQRTMNMLLMHGVRSCLEFAKSGDYNKALAAIQSGCRAPPVVSGPRRARLCRSERERLRARRRIRLRSATARAQRHARRRSARVPGRAPRPIVEGW